MINKNETIRPWKLAAGIAVLALTAGCTGGSAQPNEAPPSEAAETTSSLPEINDPAVEASALRTVDPCALLNPGVLGELGGVVPDSVSEDIEMGGCSADVAAPNGKTVELVLQIGDQIILSEDPTEKLAGLPLIVDGDEPGQCWVSVLTTHEESEQRDMSLGITFQVDYAGGDACAAGRTALDKVVQALHGNPPQYKQMPGSVVTADPCAVADRKTLESALGKKTILVESKSLFHCDFWSGPGTNFPVVSVEFFKGIAPDPTEGRPVDLGGVKAIQAVDEEADLEMSGCEVSWLKVPTPDPDQSSSYGEIVRVSLGTEKGGGIDNATACERTTAVAKSVASSLP